MVVYKDSRKQKGKRIAEKIPNQIKRINKTKFLVKSQTNSNEDYIVHLSKSGWVCTCNDYSYKQKKCKHIYALEFRGLIKHVEKKQPTWIIPEIDKTMCPYCGSDKFRKYGWRYNKRRKEQKYDCMDCHRKYCDNVGFKNRKYKPQVITYAMHFTDYLKKLSTCLGGHALMGPLFNFPLLLVEGDDDYRIWSEVPRNNSIKISVIPCNGEEIFHYQKTLEQLFDSVLDKPTNPTGFVLLDGDKNKKFHETNHIKSIKLNCHESENLYITNEILHSLGHTWESACDLVIGESSKFGQKSEKLNSIKSWDKRNHDCKDIINELSKILDTRNLVWSQRIGKELAKTHPVGELADFLGSEVIKNIWK
jgi:hypothetical protein